MKSILDKFPTPSVIFRPGTIQDVFALRLAQKLDDASAFRHYTDLVGRFPEATLLAAYRRTLRDAPEWDLGRRFLSEIERNHGNGNGNCTKVLAVRIERRTVAAAVYFGERLEFTDIRNLASTKEKALGGAAHFVTWLLDSFQLDSATLEVIEHGDEIQRHALTEAISQVLDDRLLPIWRVPRLELLQFFGHPPLKSRREIREVISAIWPVLDGNGTKCFIQDAAALGLFVQIERLFLIN